MSRLNFALHSIQHRFSQGPNLNTFKSRSQFVITSFSRRVHRIADLILLHVAAIFVAGQLFRESLWTHLGLRLSEGRELSIVGIPRYWYVHTNSGKSLRSLHDRTIKLRGCLQEI